MRYPRHGDRVRYQGRLGVIVCNRYNGMYDIDFDYNGKRPEIEKRYYYTSGSARCLYAEEFEIVEEAEYGFKEAV